MRYSFNTLNHSVIFGFPPTLPTQIRLAADAGYDAVGLDIPSVAAHAAEGVPPADIVAALSRHGIGCYEMAALRVSADSEESRRDADAAAAMAGELGAAVVYAIADEAPSPALVDNLRYAADALAAHGIRLGL